MKLVAFLIAALFAATGSYAAQQVVNIGQFPNDGTGDPARTAFSKLNANDADLYAHLYAQINGPVSIAAGTNTSVIGANVVANSMLAFMPASTIKCNVFVVAAQPTDCTPTQIATMLQGLISGTGGSGGTGTVNTINFVMVPPWETITPSITGDQQTVTIGLTPSIGANQFLATPNGANGTVGLRGIAPGDLPNTSGDVVISNSISAIQPGVVTNTDLAANVPASTLKGNCSGVPGPVTDCTVTQIDSMIGYTPGSGGGTITGSGTPLTNQLDLCTQTGIDPTGAKNSHDAVVTALAKVAGTNIELEVNCPILITIGYDPSQTIFVRSGTNLRFGPQGMFKVDNNGTPAFAFDGVSNITWVSAQIEYVGALTINIYAAPVLNVPNTFNDTYLTNDMHTYSGITFNSGVKSQWSGASNVLALLLFNGASQHITFSNPHLFVPSTANATQFIPTLAVFNINYTPNTTAVANPSLTSPTMSEPSDINFINGTYDGYYMGFLGNASLNLRGSHFLRYSDLQDASYLTNTTGGTQGGVGIWYPPPHAIYMNGQDVSFAVHKLVENTYDEGIYVGGTVRRSAGGSGTLCSIKIDAGGTRVDNYISLRPDGFLDLVSYASYNGAGSFRNLYGQYNSATLTTDSSLVFDWGMPTTGAPFQNLSVQNIMLVDTAAEPTEFPTNFLYSSNPTNQDVSLTGVKIFINDVPVAAGWGTQVDLQGTNVNVEAEYHFTNFNQTHLSVGLIAEQGTHYCVNCSTELKIFGFRQANVNFSAALASGATNGTLSTSWPFSSGTYSVTFSDGEVRYVVFTQNSTATGGWTALTSAVTAAATGGNFLNVNFNGYKPGVYLNTLGGSVYSRAHLVDVSNGYEVTATAGNMVENWTQYYIGTPSGASQATPINFPNTFGIDQKGVTVNTAVTGATSFNVGWASANTALFSGVGVGAATNPATPAFSPIVSGGQVYLYPIGGNFTGGQVAVSVRGTQMEAAR